MTTLAVMVARIADDLARTDLDTQIREAINTAISEYQKQRFRFSDSTPLTVPTFNTVIGQWIYTTADNANIGTMMGIDYLAAMIGGMLQPLTRVSPEEARIYNQQGTMSGQPMWYAVEGGAILLSPVPSAVYSMTLDVFRAVPAPATDAEAGNPWMTTAELLIRSRAKYEIALHVTRNKEMAAAMSPDPPGAAYRAWKSLKGEANRLVSPGRIKAMQF